MHQSHRLLRRKTTEPAVTVGQMSLGEIMTMRCSASDLALQGMTFGETTQLYLVQKPTLLSRLLEIVF